MILQTMPKGTHLCLLYSVAMLLEEDASILLRELGVDHTQKLWPHLPEPECYRGVAMPEIQDLLLMRKLYLSHVDAMPAIVSRVGCEPYNLYSLAIAGDRLYHYIRDQDSIIMCRTGKGVLHAVACNGTMCFDPIGREYQLSDLPYPIISVEILCKAV